MSFYIMTPRELVLTLNENGERIHLSTSLEGERVYLVDYLFYDMKRNVNSGNKGGLTIDGTGITLDEGYYEMAEFLTELNDKLPSGVSASYDDAARLSISGASSSIEVAESSARLLGISAGTYGTSATGSNPVYLSPTPYFSLSVDKFASREVRNMGDRGASFHIIGGAESKTGAIRPTISQRVQGEALLTPNIVQDVQATIFDDEGEAVPFYGSKAIFKFRIE